jgi:hypothetical protein
MSECSRLRDAERRHGSHLRLRARRAVGLHQTLLIDARSVLDGDQKLAAVTDELVRTTRSAESFSQYAVRMYARAFAVALSLVTLGCDEPNGSSSPTTPSDSTTANVRIVFMGATARRTDLPTSAQACVSGVGATHTHPSWRSFAVIPMQPVPPDRYEISFTDVPVNTRVSFRVNDQNACDENPTGAVTRNVLANDVRLIQNTTTPGNGDEPGFAFSIAPNGAISQ